MSERYWPKDVLGNEIRKGNLLVVAPGQPLVMKVVDVVEAGIMPPADEKQPPMIKQGYITLVVQLPYAPHQSAIPIAVVAKEPPESKVHLA